MAIKAGDTLTTGVITEINLNIIKVKLTEVEAEPEIFATVRGKMKRCRIRLSVGDKVTILIPQASPNLGIIRYRDKV